jgi:hypothetical protein
VERIRYATCPECREVNVCRVDADGPRTFICVGCLREVRVEAEDLRTLEEMADSEPAAGS